MFQMKRASEINHSDEIPVTEFEASCKNMNQAYVHNNNYIYFCSLCLSYEMF